MKEILEEKVKLRIQIDQIEKSNKISDSLYKLRNEMKVCEENEIICENNKEIYEEDVIEHQKKHSFMLNEIRIKEREYIKEANKYLSYMIESDEYNTKDIFTKNRNFSKKFIEDGNKTPITFKV
jgi:hypothetical protein